MNRLTSLTANLCCQLFTQSKRDVRQMTKHKRIWVILKLLLIYSLMNKIFRLSKCVVRLYTPLILSLGTCVNARSITCRSCGKCSFIEVIFTKTICNTKNKNIAHTLSNTMYCFNSTTFFDLF